MCWDRTVEPAEIAPLRTMSTLPKIRPREFERGVGPTI